LLALVTPTLPLWPLFLRVVSSVTFLFAGDGAHRVLHSFPTRRSSDLGGSRRRARPLGVRWPPVRVGAHPRQRHRRAVPSGEELVRRTAAAGRHRGVGPWLSEGSSRPCSPTVSASSRASASTAGAPSGPPSPQPACSPCGTSTS